MYVFLLEGIISVCKKNTNAIYVTILNLKKYKEKHLIFKQPEVQEERFVFD